MPPSTKCSAPEVHLLGEIVVAFGNLELFLETTIWQLLRAEGEQEKYLMAQAITAEMSFDRKVHAFGSMFRQKEVAAAESELKELIKELFDVQDERNQLMHSAWHYFDSLGGSFARMKASAKAGRGGRLRRRIHRMPAERIATTLNRIAAASQSLATFAMRYIQVPREVE